MKTRRLGRLSLGLWLLFVLSCGGQQPMQAPMLTPYPGFEAEDPALQALYWRYVRELSAPAVHVPRGRRTHKEPAPLSSRARRQNEEGRHTVYSEDECIGAVVNGTCHGSILPKSAYHPTCYGTMLNGQCTGPMF